MWVGPSGQRPLLPKDEGSGTMISAFITREHGIIREISDMILDEVNEQRLGKDYADEEAAIEIQGSSRKMPLTRTSHHSSSSSSMERTGRAIGHTTTRSSSSRMQLMFCGSCIQHLTFFFFLTTAQAMLSNIMTVLTSIG
jgi:hypothetical protein